MISPKNKIKKIFAIIFVWGLIFSLPIFVSEVNAKQSIGELCQHPATDEDCNGDCEESTLKDANGNYKSYCACNTESDCINRYKAPSDGGKWECKNGASATYNLNYCLSTQKQSRYFAVPPSDPSFLDAIFDKEATGQAIYNEIKDIAPQLSIKIPGLNFSIMQTIQDENGNFLVVPFIAQYIAAIYKFAMIIASIAAVVMIILQGLIFITSGGEAEKKSTASKRIIQVVIGMLILWGSYAILSYINPDLINFRSLKIKYIDAVELEDVVYDNHEPAPLSNPGVSKSLSNTAYDDIFKKFASCIGIDWRIYKVLAYRESGLNPTIENSLGYTGLFQTLTRYCPKNMTKMGLDTALCENPGIKDPAVNTAMITNFFKINLNKIYSACPNIATRDAVFLIYFGNANGPGALGVGLKKLGCNVKTWPNATWPNDDDVPKSLRGKKIFLGAPYSYANASADLVMSQGVTSVKVQTDSSACPTKTKILPKAQ